MAAKFFQKIFSPNTSPEEYTPWLKTAQSLPDDTKYSSRWLVFHLFKEKQTYIKALASAIFGSLSYLGFGWYLSKYATQWLTQKTPNHELLLYAALFIVSRYFFFYLYSSLCFKAGTTIVSEIKKLIYRRLLQNNYYDSVESSMIVTKVCDDLKPFYSSFIPSALSAALVGLMLIIIGFSLEIWLGAILLLSLAIIPLLMILVGIGAEAVHAQHINLFMRYSAIFYNRLQTIAEIVNLDNVASQYKFLEEKSKALNRASLKVMQVAVLSSALLELFVSIAIAGVAIYFGMSLLGIMLGENYGKGYDFHTSLFGLIITPYAFYYLRKFVTSYHDKNRALAASQWLIPLQNSYSSEKTIIPKPTFSTIEISGLNFSYPRSTCKALSNINISFSNRGLVLIKGISGSGKSTLLKILSGTLPVTEGTLSVDGMETKISSWWLKENSSFLNQTPFIFDETLAYNIFLNEQPQMKYPEFLNTILRQKELGWQTQLTRNGLQLSGGEKQLVALARLLIHPKPIVVLDEPTANLDPNTTRIVIEEIIELAKTKLVIVASHELHFEKITSYVVELNWGEQVKYA